MQKGIVEALRKYQRNINWIGLKDKSFWQLICQRAIGSSEYLLNEDMLYSLSAGHRTWLRIADEKMLKAWYQMGRQEYPGYEKLITSKSIYI